ncbi:class F sortase [Geodermatophilus sp. DSM 45219]|uniref:class F sortase n=1 Tax=Geodermatophilus sp. DSM 45219 TaxID=1881103 RepID=UPI0008901BC6|nr:class F sortase [Geodermatophilus sp. DSM 45219]SDO37538.1 Sortase family protein [Geodermatophilus sp. DSM 45219]
MSRDEQRGPVRHLAVGLAALLVLAGVGLVLLGVGTPVYAPQPPAPAAAATAPAVPDPPGAAGGPRNRPQPAADAIHPLPAANPVRMHIPAIGVTSDLLQLGLNPDDTVEVPPLSEDAPAGWYRHSPTPGELGPSVILGHVDSAEYGPGVFFELGALVPGDTIDVTRADGTTAVFAVDRVVSHPKAQFPTDEVYGDTDHAALRLVTCGGAFDERSRSYLENVIVYASLAGSAPA